jgi:hypothetical protein
MKLLFTFVCLLPNQNWKPLDGSALLEVVSDKGVHRMRLHSRRLTQAFLTLHFFPELTVLKLFCDWQPKKLSLKISRPSKSLATL